MNYTGFGQIGLPTSYTFGGGTIGGPNLWDFSSGRPQLSRAARQLGTVALPAGALSRQEIRNRADVQQVMTSGVPYVEMPTMYQLNQRGQYVDPLTGRTMGTMAINYSAGGWRNIEGKEIATGGGYSPRTQAMRAAQGKKPEGPESVGYKESGGPQPASKNETKITKTEMGESGAPIAFTPFGQTVRDKEIEEIQQSPFGSAIAGILGFGGIPRFPYAGY